MAGSAQSLTVSSARTSSVKAASLGAIPGEVFTPTLGVLFAAQASVIGPGRFCFW